MLRILSVLFLFVCTVFSSVAQIQITNQGGTAAAIIGGFVGQGLTITNPVINCPAGAYGTFTNGPASHNR
jgi:hypothetical protein